MAVLNDSSFPHIVTCIHFSFLGDSSSNRVEMESQYDFDLHFSAI